MFPPALSEPEAMLGADRTAEPYDRAYPRAIGGRRALGRLQKGRVRVRPARPRVSLYPRRIAHPQSARGLARREARLGCRRSVQGGNDTGERASTRALQCIESRVSRAVDGNWGTGVLITQNQAVAYEKPGATPRAVAEMGRAPARQGEPHQFVAIDRA